LKSLLTKELALLNRSYEPYLFVVPKLTEEASAKSRETSNGKFYNF
jgi:hypothetical protein